VAVDDDIAQQRREVIGQFKKTSYKRIYDLGCGGAGTLGFIHQAFPKATLVGGDLNERCFTQWVIAQVRPKGLIYCFGREDACKVFRS